MSELLSSLSSSLRWIDLLDIAIVAFILYRILLLIKGTRGMQMLTGMGILGIGFFLSSTMELFTTHWILSYFFDYVILIVIVVFQDDLRRALSNVGKNPFFSSLAAAEEKEMVSEIARAATKLAGNRTGALIVLERETGLKNFIDTGSQIDSRVQSELLFSIFLPASPIHDGAAIITQGKIAAAGCFLPLSKDPNIDKRLGTRHRAAIGLTEDSDAIVVLVSEEAGEAYIVRGGRMTSNLSETELVNHLSLLLDFTKGRSPLGEQIRHWWVDRRKSRERRARDKSSTDSKSKKDSGEKS